MSRRRPLARCWSIWLEPGTRHYVQDDGHRVINNVSVGNAEYGVLNRQFSAGGCLVDHNLAWNNGVSAVSGSR